MQSPILTNALLAVIAVLLLVMIVQNAGSTSKPSSAYSYSTPPMQNPHGTSSSRNPTVDPSAPMMAASMYFQAMSAFPEGCEGKSILAECSSPAAEQVKQEINALAQSGQGPRQVFDYIINKYGMAALTPEAQRIRSMRTQ